jgi:RimJ/RimL family protein N-acetyltransferase
MADTGSDVLKATKAAASSPHPALSIPIGHPVVGLLRPVATRPEWIWPADVRALTEWRNRFVHAFLTEFVATEQRTARWLAESVGPDDSRILFMVEDLGGRTVGHAGLAFIDWETGSAELDAFVRGAEGPAGLLARALETIWRWGRAALGLSSLVLRVRSDNSAVAYFERRGFREIRRVPLRREQLADGARWVEDPSLTETDVSLVYMELEEDVG